MGLINSLQFNLICQIKEIQVLVPLFLFDQLFLFALFQYLQDLFQKDPLLIENSDVLTYLDSNLAVLVISQNGFQTTKNLRNRSV